LCDVLRISFGDEMVLLPTQPLRLQSADVITAAHCPCAAVGLLAFLRGLSLAYRHPAKSQRHLRLGGGSGEMADFNSE
jgi:hypothetical protein